MSYSFYWDCALPISNIRDIVNINIVPSTNAVNEGDYISVRGYVGIDGEYISLSGVQYLFSERVPLDITLPSEGCVGEIRTDVSNFDYTIQSSNQLHLTLNLTIHGYEVRMDDIIVSSEAEAVEYNQSFEHQLEEIDLGLEEEVLDPDRKDKQLIKKPVVMPVEEVVVQTQVEEVIEVKEPVVTEVVVKEEIVEPVETAFPFVSKPEVKETVGPKEKSKIFEMLYELDSEPTEVVEEVVEVKEDVVVTHEEPVIETEVVEEVVEEVEVKEEPAYGHFDDGESVMKFIFIQEEVVTVEEICDKYDVPANCVEGLNGSNTVFHCNDRVMIRYDRN